jgi:hypothetical protein
MGGGHQRGHGKKSGLLQAISRQVCELAKPGQKQPPRSGIIATLLSSPVTYIQVTVLSPFTDEEAKAQKARSRAVM